MTLCISVHSQAPKDLQKMMYLNSNFIEGKVLFKTGVSQSANLNYDADNLLVAYEQDGKFLVVTNPQDIDTVFIADKKFIPIREKFYEVIASAKEASLLALYICKKHPVESTVDHLGMSKKSSEQISNTVSSAYLTRKFQPDYNVEFYKQYSLKLQGQNNCIKVNNVKSFVKAFPTKEAAITQYVNDNKINFQNETDILNLMKICKN